MGLAEARALRPGFHNPLLDIEIIRDRTAYVAGPVSGMPNLNRQMFMLVTNALLSMGYRKVINPLDVANDPKAASEAQRFGKGAVGMPGWIGAMRKCFHDIATEVDDIWALPDWQNSSGATAEIFLGDLLKLRVFDSQTGNLLKIYANLSVTSANV